MKLSLALCAVVPLSVSVFSRPAQAASLSPYFACCDTVSLQCSFPTCAAGFGEGSVSPACPAPPANGAMLEVQLDSPPTAGRSVTLRQVGASETPHGFCLSTAPTCPPSSSSLMACSLANATQVQCWAVEATGGISGEGFSWANVDPGWISAHPGALAYAVYTQPPVMPGTAKLTQFADKGMYWATEIGEPSSFSPSLGMASQTAIAPLFNDLPMSSGLDTCGGILASCGNYEGLTSSGGINSFHCGLSSTADGCPTGQECNYYGNACLGGRACCTPTQTCATQMPVHCTSALTFTDDCGVVQTCACTRPAPAMGKTGMLGLGVLVMGLGVFMTRKRAR